MAAYGYVQLSLSKSWQLTASIGELRTEVWHGFASHRSVEDSHHGTFRRSAFVLWEWTVGTGRHKHRRPNTKNTYVQRETNIEA